MCFRYYYEKDDLLEDEAFRAATFEPQEFNKFETVYNAFPTSVMPVLASMKGIIPMKFSNNYEHVNVRAESIIEYPSIRRKFEMQRCLIPASGFYESKKMKTGTVPYLTYLADKKPFFMAGMYDIFKQKGRGEAEPEFYFTIITTEANSLINQIHDRMPVIVDAENAKKFLFNEPGYEDPISYLKSFPGERMAMHPVSARLNKNFNTPDVIEPIEEQKSLF